MMEQRTPFSRGSSRARLAARAFIFALAVAATVFHGCRSGVEAPDARAKNATRPGTSRPSTNRAKSAPQVDQDQAQRLLDEMLDEDRRPRPSQGGGPGSPD